MWDEAENAELALKLCGVEAIGEPQRCVLPGHRGFAKVDPNGLWYRCEDCAKPVALQIADVFASVRYGKVVRLSKKLENGTYIPRSALLAVWLSRIEFELDALSLDLPQVEDFGPKGVQSRALLRGFVLLWAIRQNAEDPPTHIEYAADFASAWVRPWRDIPPRTAHRAIRGLVKHGYLAEAHVEGAGHTKYRYRPTGKGLINQEEEGTNQQGDEGS